MFEIDNLKFDANGLIPAIIVDDDTKKVLMLAYMNRESLKISIERGLTCFWSRSRKELWLKGETSGNYQHIKSITADCDNDTLLISVKPDGPACHLGTESCFDDRPRMDFDEKNKNNENTKLCGVEHENKPCSVEHDNSEKFSINDLVKLIEGRKTDKVEGSYTSYLFEKGLDKILKKVGEESTEVIIAAKDKDKKETIYEIADLTYHILVLMVEAGISPEDIMNELKSRHVIDHKVKQEKMTA